VITRAKRAVRGGSAIRRGLASPLRHHVRAALLCLVCSACGTDEPREETSPLPPPADALEARLRERYEEVSVIMMQHGDIVRGEVAQGDARDHSHVMETGYCYEVDVVGSESIEDLDLRLYDANDVLLQRDTTQDREPMIGRDRQICPYENGTYRISVRAVRGGGPYALQVFRTL
jgi:hypothetical protein